MKKAKTLLGIVAGATLAFRMLLPAFAASGPNDGKSTHYDNTLDTSTYYTAWGKNKYDGAIHRVQHKILDNPLPIYPKSVFNYNFDWVPANVNYWPIS
jgi:hypothetical protein